MSSWDNQQLLIMLMMVCYFDVPGHKLVSWYTAHSLVQRCSTIWVTHVCPTTMPLWTGTIQKQYVSLSKWLTVFCDLTLNTDTALFYCYVEIQILPSYPGLLAYGKLRSKSKNNNSANPILPLRWQRLNTTIVSARKLLFLLWKVKWSKYHYTSFVHHIRSCIV